MLENVIMFLKSDRRATKSSLSRVGVMLYLGKLAVAKDIFAYQKSQWDWQHRFRNTPEQNTASVYTPGFIYMK